MIDWRCEDWIDYLQLCLVQVVGSKLSIQLWSGCNIRFHSSLREASFRQTPFGHLYKSIASLLRPASGNSLHLVQLVPANFVTHPKNHWSSNTIVWCPNMKKTIILNLSWRIPMVSFIYIIIAYHCYQQRTKCVFVITVLPFVLYYSLRFLKHKFNRYIRPTNWCFFHEASASYSSVLLSAVILYYYLLMIRNKMVSFLTQDFNNMYFY
jgi:hypothetical protein